MTAKTEPVPDMVLDITGTFDIARARNRLRELVNKHNLPLMLRARSAATLTTLSELVLFKSTNTHKKLELTVRVLDDDSMAQGLEFSFYAPFTSDISQNFSIAEWQLERSCDELGINNQGELDYIIMRLWVRRRKGR